MNWSKHAKTPSFSLIELIIALIISGLVIMLVFNFTHTIQKKFKDRKLFSTEHTERSISLFFELKDLHKKQMYTDKSHTELDNMEFYTISQTNNINDTVVIQLTTPELKKITDGF